MEEQMDPVFAYIDGGTGSLIIQALIAGAIAIPIFMRAQIARGVSALRRAMGRGDREPARDA